MAEAGKQFVGPTRAMDSLGAAWMMGAAALLIGIGTVLTQLDVSTLLVTVALAATSIAALAPGSWLLRQFRRRSVVTVLVAAIAIQAIASASQSTVSGVWYPLAMLGIAVVGVHAVLVESRWRTAELVLVIAGHFVLMAIMLRVSGAPDIDVYRFQQEGSAALLRGENPFAMTFLNTAGPDSPYYSPEVLDADRLNFGFIYPPLSLLMALPGYLIAGDYRYGALGAVSLTAFLIGSMRPGPLAIGAALLMLFAPITGFLLYWGWTDPFVVLLLALTVVLAARRAGATPVALGLLIASKQYVAPLYVLAIVLLRGARRRVGLARFAWIPLVVGGVTVVPFVVWDASAFIYSTVTVHLLQPFRIDSLSIPAMLARNGFTTPVPGWLPFAAATAIMAVALWRAPRTNPGFCVSTAVVLMTFFLLSKQAFLHYYFLPLVALCLGIAATGPVDGRDEPDGLAR